MDDGWLMAEAGACCAWPLPADATCARVARRLFRRVAGALRLDGAAVEDGEMIVSELAANTLHVVQRGQPGSCELWLYLRGSGEQCELVCKVFDAAPGWLPGALARGGRKAPADAVGGRGLEVVHELSGGRWGHHLTRSRLGGWALPGKAVWFATPAPYARKPRQPGLPGSPAASDAISRLERELAARGIDVGVGHIDDPATDTSVLVLCGELAVWCRSGCAWLHEPGLAGPRRSYEDLVEVAEQAVEAHEKFCAQQALARARA